MPRKTCCTGNCRQGRDCPDATFGLDPDERFWIGLIVVGATAILLITAASVIFGN